MIEKGGKKDKESKEGTPSKISLSNEIGSACSLSCTVDSELPVYMLA